MDDSQIIELFVKRSEDAILAAAAKYSGYCRSIVQRILPCAEDAEECLNDTWLAAWNSIPPQRPRALNVYLGRVARNLALNRRKHLSAEKRGGGEADLVLEELSHCIPSAAGPEAWMEEQHLKGAIDAFLRTQPERRRRVFIRRYWALESVQAIAKDLQMTRGQVSTILYRMRNDLRLYLEKEGITL